MSCLISITDFKQLFFIFLQSVTPNFSQARRFVEGMLLSPSGKSTNFGEEMPSSRLKRKCTAEHFLAKSSAFSRRNLTFSRREKYQFRRGNAERSFEEKMPCGTLPRKKLSVFSQKSYFLPQGKVPISERKC